MRMSDCIVQAGAERALADLVAEFTRRESAAQVAAAAVQEAHRVRELWPNCFVMWRCGSEL